MSVRRHLSLLTLLKETHELQRIAILKTLTAIQLRMVREAIYNLLKGTCPVSDTLKKKLSPHQTVIRQLVSKQLSRQQQQRLLVKHAALLPLVLKPVLDWCAAAS